MVRLGIQPQAVKLKMAREGFDPALLDLDPNGPAPGLPAPVSTKEESDEETSSASFDDYTQDVSSSNFRVYVMNRI
jgi:hypothetical protein